MMGAAPNRKLEFFIGGTRRDLGVASRNLIDAVLEARHIPSGMELWSCGVEPLLTDIANHLGQCDVHIILLGARYGEHVAGQQISFTEWEYVQSKDKRPILAFLLKDADFISERKKAIAEDPAEADREGALTRFREELRRNRFCKFFSNTEAGIAELGRLCGNAIHELINEKHVDESAGWIRAGCQELLTLRQIEQNKFLERELRRMREFTIVGDRVPVDRVAKEIQGQVFWKSMMGPIRRHGYKNLFVESGSTLAYVSETFEEFVLKNDLRAGAWHIWTNNVLALLQLSLYTDVDVRRFPPYAPDPEDKYGAIFPRDWHGLEERPPTKPRALHKGEAKAVGEMRKDLLKFAEKTLFLATTSGWDLDHLIEGFRGPHVGSHPNMLFKRALFLTRKPVVIFLTAEKLGDSFENGKCYPVFGPDEPLDTTLAKCPLALCVGYDQTILSPARRQLAPDVRKDRNRPDRVADVLSALGFNVVYGKEEGDRGAILAGNPMFARVFPND